jgi:DNA segregation ATPase FtsK/SpoIIIE, S-DNA-T family
MTRTHPAGPPAVPLGPALSMFDPIYLGIDEYGAPVYLELVYRNLLAGGEPGGGKSGLLNVIAAHAALSTDARLVLFDGKLVELGMWRHVADEFVTANIRHAIDTLRRCSR